MESLEYIGTGLGLLCVYLIIRQNIFCWPVGIVTIGIYTHIFFEAKLYSDVLLQGVYLLLHFYGWFYWLKRKPDSEAPLLIQTLSGQAKAAWLTTAITTTYALGFIMGHYTDASVPYFDASTTTISLIAQWLMTRKFIENWLVWIFVDLLAASVYFYKGLNLTAFLYIVYACMGTYGFASWKRSLTEREEPAFQGV